MDKICVSYNSVKNSNVIIDTGELTIKLVKPMSFIEKNWKRYVTLNLIIVKYFKNSPGIICKNIKKIFNDYNILDGQCILIETENVSIRIDNEDNTYNVSYYTDDFEKAVKLLSEWYHD